MASTSKPFFPKACSALNEKEMSVKYAKQKRTGKTAKDKASGSWANRINNQQARQSEQDSRSKK
jgi:hypothetical protein